MCCKPPASSLAQNLSLVPVCGCFFVDPGLRLLWLRAVYMWPVYVVQFAKLNKHVNHTQPMTNKSVHKYSKLRMNECKGRRQDRDATAVQCSSGE